jgi:hypothetical protein
VSQARPSLLRSRSPNVVPSRAVPPRVEPPRVVPPRVVPPRVVPPRVEPPRVVPPRVEPPRVVPPVQSVASPALLSRTRVNRKQTVAVEDSDAEDNAAHTIGFGMMFNVS